MRRLTDNAEQPEKVRQNIIEVALDYLSCGLDPEQSTLLIQSQIPELCELSFLLYESGDSFQITAEPYRKVRNSNAQL